jgi:hypothetical protein
MIFWILKYMLLIAVFWVLRICRMQNHKLKIVFCRKVLFPWF